MKKLHEIHQKSVYPERVLQFGEGNFLRGFVDWMIDSMNKNAGFNSSVIVVQPLENGLVEMLNEQNGLYTLYLNGIKDGDATSEHTLIESISRGINPYLEYDKYMDIARNPELRFVVSNTTEAGIVFDESDKLEYHPQKTFPGKLTALLYERYKAFNGDMSKGLILIPCELIDNNGAKLKEIIIKYANLWKLKKDFVNWIEGSNTFCNSLVDRIVTGYPKERIDEITKELGYEDKMVVEGEHFHLWVVEGPEKIKEEFPAEKAVLNVLFTKDMSPYRTRKVRILNGAHTTMVPVAYLYGLDTVREAVEDKVIGEFVNKAIFEEIVPTLDLPRKELDDFANAVLERFRNPYNKHFLTSIALNSNSKFETRVLPSLLKYYENNNALPKKLVFSLAALIRFYRGERNGDAIEIKDNKEIIDLYKKLWNNYDGTEKSLRNIVVTILAQEKIWKSNLNKIEGLTDKVVNHLMDIENLGIKNAIKKVM